MGWLTEVGRVVAVEADAVWVEADRSSACGRCAARAGCGQGALASVFRQGKGRVRAISGGGLDASECALDDQVIIKIPEATLLSGTLSLYGFPLVAAAALSVWASALGDLWAAGAFCVGLIAAFAILYAVSRRLNGQLPGFSHPLLAAKALQADSDVSELSLRTD